MDQEADEKRERLRRAGLMNHGTDGRAPRKRDAKILPFKRIPKPSAASATTRRIAGGVFVLLLAAIVFVGMR